MNYWELRNEIVGDPLARGYSGMTDSEIADDLNTVYRTRTLERLETSDVYNAVDVTEFLALGATQQQEIWDILHVGGNLWVRPGDLARERFVTLFGGGSDTITALADMLTQDISRATELGFGLVLPSDVGKAQALV